MRQIRRQILLDRCRFCRGSCFVGVSYIFFIYQLIWDLLLCYQCFHIHTSFSIGSSYFGFIAFWSLGIMSLLFVCMVLFNIWFLRCFFLMIFVLVVEGSLYWDDEGFDIINNFAVFFCLNLTFLRIKMLLPDTSAED